MRVFRVVYFSETSDVVFFKSVPFCLQFLHLSLSLILWNPSLLSSQGTSHHVLIILSEEILP